MGNDIRREQNNSIRKIKSTLDTLNQLVKTKEDIITKTPELSLVDKFATQSDVTVVEDEQFSSLCEQAASLQFSGEEKNSICKTLDISAHKYKEIVLSPEFIEIKRRIAEDQKMNLLAKVLKQVDGAISALEDLAGCADEDKTRLNAAALILEHTERLLDDQKSSALSPQFNNTMNNAAAGALAEGGTVTLQQMIINQRASRGLSG